MSMFNKLTPKSESIYINSTSSSSYRAAHSCNRTQGRQGQRPYLQISTSRSFKTYDAQSHRHAVEFSVRNADNTDILW